MQEPDWLDTETRSILSKMPPVKHTAVDVESYSLLLLDADGDRQRTLQVISEIGSEESDDITKLPMIVSRQLSLDDAMAGQFSLACCDCVSAFVADAIVNETNTDYLQQLFDAVKNSDEFEHVSIRVISIPLTEAGRQFSWQFLGMAVGFSTPCELLVHRKKARLMFHWAEKCGVRLSGGLW